MKKNCLLWIILAMLFAGTSGYAQEKNLDVDPYTMYWQPVLHFCSKEKVDVKKLCESVHSDKFNVKYNSILILGVWLLEESSIDDIFREYSNDADIEIKIAVVSSIEVSVSNIDKRDQMLKKMLESETNEEVIKYINESLENSLAIRKNIAEWKKTDVDKKAFEKSYKKLWDSYGSKGDYDVLFDNVTYENEKQLLKLRTRVMKRQSDEAMYDYSEINQAILKERWMLNN